MKYAVIGGQYERHFYGVCETLHSAKLLATKNTEYWDNWQGEHKPEIYNLDDCVKVITNGMITYVDGTEVYFPNNYAEPTVWWNGKKWEEN